MHEAKYYEKLGDNKVHCYLCPRHCKIGDGQPGFCFIRTNDGGTLYQRAYNQPYAINIDPIEKKPLFHFHPGTDILSIGTAGCNMGCKFCQNWDISKAKHDHDRAFDFTPEAASDTARSNNCLSMAYTYNEPTIWAEYVEDLSREARSKGLYNVMVTNGYITPEVIDDVYENIDAANVDLKAFTERFYSKITLTHLEPVLEALKLLQEKGIWIELTTLVIPEQNDSNDEFREMCEWVIDNLGPDVPMHFTAFHPDYKMKDTSHTPSSTLEHARDIAMDIGVQYAYVGNVYSDNANTYCPNCGELLIQRNWLAILDYNIDDNRCSGCGESIPGHFEHAAIKRNIFN
ncbi:MAG: AmmeMemoRadiSam system radical SAM enzyme [Candidatus Marinimicrobia bacterium]|nr:AmmeMemoRadiSam system radical SAM enzyme [Candidatus Neomarinimicrobiota bacterium]MCF7828028.1 AmmeMemoRadiSam system radical SAM enzyme [Candidatus Neomarinimicrobiota bacterium]MCF7879217.1 AmmeMemoRadiSam system radical SAM enzyme [Candidatus Neomarinimicrobiota bacterium]